MSLPVAHSLRARLLWLLLGAVSLGAIAQAVIVYRTAVQQADAIIDFHMQQMALSLRTGTPLSNHGALSGRGLGVQGGEFVLQVWTADGVRVFQSIDGGAPPQPAGEGFSEVQAEGTTFRVFTVRTPSQTIQVAQEVAARGEMAGALAWRTVVPTLFMAPLLLLAVWWVVSRSLAPVARVRTQVAARQAQDLAPVSAAGLPDEIRPLVLELNLLLARVKTAFDTQRNFVADAAHELRSPLAALKLQLQSLQRATDPETREVAVTRLAAGIERATRLVEQLMLMARQEDGASAGAMEPVALAEAARVALADVLPLARARAIDLGLVHTDETRIAGHGEALRVLAGNLIDNAVKYTPDSGHVDVAVRTLSDGVHLVVEDSGPGIPAEDLARVFDRFYRVPGSQTTGSGLGLAIVKAIAERHGATVSLDKSVRLGGLKVDACFPVTA